MRSLFIRVSGVLSPSFFTKLYTLSYFVRIPALPGEWLQEWTAGGLIYPVLVGSGARVRNYTLVEEWISACFKIRESLSENSGS
jgi:hypothetical protein